MQPSVLYSNFITNYNIDDFASLCDLLKDEYGFSVVDITGHIKMLVATEFCERNSIVETFDKCIFHIHHDIR